MTQKSLRSALAVLAPVLALVLPIALRALLRGDLEVYDTRDETLFHLPTIERFAAQLPRPDLSDYASATTPLYHLLLAPLAALTGDALLPLRLATLALALALLGCAAQLLARRALAPAWALSLLLLPLGLSPYFLGPAVRLSTDDAALLFVVASLWALDGARDATGRLRLGRLALAALAAAAAILTRQVHGWLVGLLVLLPLLARGEELGRRALGLLLASLPVLALLPLALAWHGLTPPSFSEHEAGLNPEVLTTELAVLGGLGLAHAPWLLPLHREHPLRSLAAAALGGAALLALHPQPWVEDDLRYGGSLWRLASHTPDLLGTTALFWLLVPLGLLWLGAFLIDGLRRRDPLPASALVLFLVANVASARAYQKYYEPFLLLLLAWIVSRAPPRGRAAWLGPGLLALAWLGIALMRFVR